MTESRIQVKGDKEYDEQRSDETATDKTDDSEKLRNLQTDHQYAKNSDLAGIMLAFIISTYLF
ncbi:MAG: hypothetical protein ACLRL6_11790 [Clostridium sp.]